MIPHGYLQNLHQLWALKVLEPAGLIAAIYPYGYTLSYISLDGIGVEKENEKFEFRYGTRI
jgi:hypothetical protein